MPEASTERSVDMLTLATAKSNRFAIRYSLILLGLAWYSAGGILAAHLIVTNEPPKFPLCEDGTPVSPPEGSPPLNCDLPVSAELACDPMYSQYLGAGNSVISQFNLLPSHCNSTRPDAVLIQSLVLISMGVSALVAVPFGDKWGRKVLVGFGTWGALLGQLIASFSPIFWFYALSTAVASASLVMLLVATCVTAAELMPTGSRHYLALTQVIGFAVGGAVVAGFSNFLQSWRSIILVTALPFLPFVSGCVWISGLFMESPKWLASKGRMDEAYEIWKRISTYNSVDQRDLISLDDFIRTEVESTRATVIKTPEELDEELSIMSVQYLAAPDSVIKACSNFPTSIWLGCLAWAWAASGTVYSGIWHTRYSPLIDELLKSGITDPVNLDSVSTLAPARLLQMAPILNPSVVAGPPVQPAMAAPMAAPAELVRNQPLPPNSPQLGDLLAALSRQGTLPSDAPRMLSTETLTAVADTDLTSKVEDSLGSVDKDAREYIDFINAYLKDGGNFLMDKAKAIPEKAHKIYDDYEMEKMLNDLRNDFDFYAEKIDARSEALRTFQNKSKVLLLFTTMTYILDLPCALLIIGLSGRSWCGRKGAILSYSFSSGCMILAAGCLSYTQSMKTVLPVSMAVAGRSMLSGVYQMLFVYTSECVPTSVRCGCVGLMLGISCLVAGVTQPLADLIDTRFKEGTLFLIGAAAISASFIGTTILPDTLGLPLCDTLEIQEVMYENLGYHEMFFERKLHRVVAFLYQKLCCIKFCFGKSKSARGGSLEEKGRFWLKSKINNRSRKQLFEKMSPMYGHDENTSPA